jgi:hypothetical protein
VRQLAGLLHDGTIFGFCSDLGVVEIRAKNLKSLQERLGDDFVSVEQGLLVAIDMSLILNARERLCGLKERVVDGHATIQWVSASRRGMLRLLTRLFGASKHAA